MRTEPPVLSVKEVPEWDAIRMSGNGREYVKIVLGELGDDKGIPGSIPDLASIFPNLTHLHLWGLSDLTHLPALPSSLKVLDVRGCKNLQQIGDLPDTLETLDLADCGSLARLPKARGASLRYIYLDRCGTLKDHSVRSFLDALPSDVLEEFEAASCPAMTTLDELPSSVRRLVLNDCTNLVCVDALKNMSRLDHLNLSGCSHLVALPFLPASVRYVLLNGADRLDRFGDQDIGSYDRGTSADKNVAAGLHSRRKFGDKLGASAHAKLLLLGDGRAGKTTLAKRLQWETLTPAERGARPDLRPTETPPTHKMKFWRWDAPIVIPDEVAQRRRLQDLEERANARGVELPKDAKGRLRAAIRIWDFGGQEIYHNTHRVFAAEGSVFLLVWRPAPLDEIAIAKECPEGVTQDEWREYNRQRSLDYWLEYIDSMRPDAKVALVCTFTKEEDSQIPWRTRAPRHRGRDLPCFYVDNDPASGDENPQGELKRLQDWIAKECGREALRIGVLQPRFYGEVAARVDRMLEENDDARQTHRRSPNLIYAWNEWCSRVTEVASGSELDNADIETITGYLHDAGQLFWLKAGGEQAVIVAMEWATELIYRMLRPGSDLHRKILDNWGWLPLAELEEEDEWKRVPSNLMRDQLLTFMEQCGVLVRGVEGHESRSGHPVFVANEKWLLPRADHPGLEERIDADMETARRQANMSCVEFSFENSRVSEFMLRSLMASMGSAFGRNAVWYRNGFQAMPDDQRPDWCFRVWWTPDEPDGFLGTLCAVLVCRQQGSESIVARLEGLFSTAGPDLAGAARRRAGIADLSMERLFPLRPGEEDVGVSSSGSDKVQAEELVKALKASDLNAVWYQSPECRRGPNAEVKVFMEERLRSAPCMILLLSDAYLEDDPDRNWYCPWELADAIIQWSEGRRSIERTFVVYMPQQTVNSRNASDVVAHLFPSLSRAYAERYKAKPPEQWPNFQYYNDLALHFGKAWQDGRIGEFFQKRGTLGTYTRIDSTLGAKKFDELITALRTALAGRSK